MYQSPSSDYASRSPPPLHHPIPTHPPVTVPDPPVTPNPHGRVQQSAADAHISSAHSRAANASSSSQTGGNGSYARYSSPPIQQPNPYATSSFNDPYAPGQQRQQTSGPSSPYYSNQQRGGQGPNQPGQGIANNLNVPWPGFGSNNVMNDATAQMGVQFGRHVAQVGGEYVERNFNALLPVPLLKHYFNVSNSYVLHKLRLVLFPWRHRPWSRLHRHGGGVNGVTGSEADSGYGGYGSPRAGNIPMKSDKGNFEGFAPPREDVNSPDLYIPVMAIVTYTIIASIISGLNSRFHPEVLGLTASRALGIVIIEFVAVKLGCYLLNIQGDHTIVDLLAYGGYKFVGTTLTLAIGLLGAGRWLYISAFTYTVAANGFFLLRSLRYVILPDPSSPSSVTITHAQRTVRLQFLFSIAAFQIPLSGLLIYGVS